MTLWQGRFGTAARAPEMTEFLDSLPYDRRLYVQDVTGSKAHVRGLVRARLLTIEEGDAVLAALDETMAELAGETFVFEPGDEDIHTAVERRVTELAGEAGAKLHTGRSRNDQVATDLRLYIKTELRRVCEKLVGLRTVLFERAMQADDAYLPGYTHLQQAQPVLLAHHLLAHGWALGRDFERLLDARQRVDVSPLGAGALAGTSLPLDPDAVAADLGFGARFENSMDAVSDRDFVAEVMFVLALLQVHLSRIGEEVILWATQEFGFIHLADGYSTGSSMLPQKKNPDIAELSRGKAGRLIGNLAGFLATLKGLPLAYNRDLGEDKEPVFDSLDQALITLDAITGLIGTVQFDVVKMKMMADQPGSAAIDLAEFLVERNVPFRKAHEVVGGLVRKSIEDNVPLADLVRNYDLLGTEAAQLLEPGVAVTRRTSAGAAGPDAVAVQLERFKAALDSDLQRLESTAFLDTPEHQANMDGET